MPHTAKVFEKATPNKGIQMQIKCNVLDRQFQMHQEEYEEAALRVLRSGWDILGKEVEQFEEARQMRQDFSSDKN